MLRRILSILIVVLCLSAAEALADSWAVVNNPTSGDWLNLRGSASTGGEVLARYYNGTFVRVTGDTSGEWVQVLIGTGPGSQAGYFMKKYLCMTPENGGYACEIKQAVTLSPAPLQCSMNGTWQTLATLPGGASVTLLGETNDRYQITMGTVCGWVMKSDVTLASMAQPAATIAPAQSANGWDDVWGNSGILEEQPAVSSSAEAATTVINTQSVNIANLWYVTLSLERSGTSYLVRITQTLTGSPSDSITGWSVFLNGAYIGNADGYHVDTDPAAVTRFVCVLGATDAPPETITIVPMMEYAGIQQDIQISVSGR